MQATEKTIVDSLPTRKQAIIAVATAKVVPVFQLPDHFFELEGSWALCNRRGVLASHHQLSLWRGGREESLPRLQRAAGQGCFNHELLQCL